MKKQINNKKTIQITIKRIRIPYVFFGKKKREKKKGEEKDQPELNH
jgi:hypothetical protein